MESNVYYNALRAGENEAKDYLTWVKNYDLQEKKKDSFSILYNYDDKSDDDDESQEQNDPNDDYKDPHDQYMLFLLDVLTIHDDIYEYKMLDWVADWWRNFDPESKYYSSCNYFWENIWRNPNSGFLFVNRLHIFHIMNSGVSRIEKPVECQYHLGELIGLFIDIVNNEGSGNHIDWDFAVQNTHPKVMKLVEGHFENGFKEGEYMNKIYAYMCQYSHQIHLIEKYQHLLFDDTNEDQDNAWYYLGYNKNAVHYFEKYRNKWESSTYNYSSMVSCAQMLPLLESHMENGFKNQSEWTTYLCKYDYAISFIEPYVEYFNDECWKNICKNPGAIALIEIHFNKIIPENHHILYGNPNAVKFAQEKNVLLDSEAWDFLVDNPNAIDFIEQHIHDLTEEKHIMYLNENVNAFPLLEKHKHLIRPEILLHPQIFYKKPAKSQ
jgi:hypothetical protein